MPIEPTQNADILQEAVRRKLDAALREHIPKEVWHAYARRDTKRLSTDQYPCVYVVNLAEQILEEETDNRVLVGYPFDVILMVNEAAVMRTAADLIAVRRLCSQAVYTTRYTDTPLIEHISYVDAPRSPLDGFEQGITATGFGIILGVLERRSIDEEYP